MKMIPVRGSVALDHRMRLVPRSTANSADPTRYTNIIHFSESHYQGNGCLYEWDELLPIYSGADKEQKGIMLENRG